jgi:two-component system LytT family sensor kinase
MKKSVVILLHLLYWMCFILLIAFVLICIQQGRNEHIYPGPHIVIAFYISAIIPGVIAFYSFYTFLFSRFLTQKRIIAFFLYGALMVGLAALGGTTGIAIAFRPHFLSPFPITSAIIIMVAIPNAAIGLVLKGFITWYGDIKLKAELSKKNYETELALVKSHINPHFLFNTINNIDVLIGKDAVKASDYLNKLSDIMRFMLYETKAEKIALEKEQAYIEKYIALQKIRTAKAGYVHYTIEGNMDGIMIEPFLFIPFIENAFKHSSIAENAINIKFVIEKQRLVFYCDNIYNKAATMDLDHGGIGNDLIQKRLSLLYPGRHSLDVTDVNGIYKVKLVININGDKLHNS